MVSLAEYIILVFLEVSVTITMDVIKPLTISIMFECVRYSATTQNTLETCLQPPKHCSNQVTITSTTLANT